MQFASPLWLLAVLALPALWWAGRRGRGGAPGVRYSVADDAAALGATGWARVRWLPAALVGAAFGLGVVALARPQERDASVERSTEGVDIVLALDVSTSMTAEDFVPNRFEAAKAVAAEFVRGGRRTGSGSSSSPPRPTRRRRSRSTTRSCSPCSRRCGWA